MRIVFDNKKLIHNVIFFFLVFAIMPHNGGAESSKRESVQPKQGSVSAPFIFSIQAFRNLYPVPTETGVRCIHPVQSMRSMRSGGTAALSAGL
jgi:hypothetical protein